MKTGSNAFIRAGTCCSAGKKCAQAGCGFFRARSGCRWKSTPCGCASKGTSPGWLARSRLPARLNGASTKRWSKQRIFLFAAPSRRTPRGVADGRSGSWSLTTLLLCPPGSLPRCSSSRTRRYLLLFLDSRVLNPKLLEIGLVPGRIEVILPQFRQKLLHFLFVELNGRLIVRSEEGFVMDVLGLHRAKVFPSFLDKLRLQQKIQRGHRLHLGAGGGTLVRNRRGHGNSVRPAMPRKVRDIGRIQHVNHWNVPTDIANIIGGAANLVFHGRLQRLHLLF